MRNFAKKILIAGSVLVAAVMAAIPAHAQVSQQNYWNLANQTLTPLISTWQVGNSNTNAAFNNLTVTGTCTGCGSGGGGGGGGTFSTSTSQVPGHLNNYANNTTDIVEVGGNSTSTAKFIFDPNSLIEYVSGSIGIGTKSPNYNLEVNGTASTTVLNIGKLTGPLQGTAGLVSVAPLGSLFSTTSANYWSSQGLGFSTTSNAFWLTLNQGNAFSTTSANYWGSQQSYLTTVSANSPLGGSGTSGSPLTCATCLTTGTSLGSLFSTTSANFWLTLNQGNAWSTTSAAYWGGIQGYLTGNQAITLTGDITGSGATAITTVLKNTGAGSGSCTNCNVTFDAQGRETAYSNGSGGGGSGGSLLLYQNPQNAYYVATTTAQWEIGENSTTTLAKLEVNGGIFASASSTFPFLTTQQSTSTNATTTTEYDSKSLTIASLSGVLKGTSGLVSTAANGTDYTLLTAANCAAGNAITGLTASGGSTCANAFSTTSAAYWQTQNNFFSTTSANYWSSQGLGFSTTSSAYWLTLNQGNAFSTTSANYWGGIQGYLTSAVTSLAQTYGTGQTGAVTLGTSSTAYDGLTFGDGITNSGAAFTFKPIVSGTLTVAGGGTGLASIASSSIIIGNVSGGYTQYATSSLGLQSSLTLTTSGSSGAATLSGLGVLNIPQYSGGGGANFWTASSTTGYTYLNNNKYAEAPAFVGTSTATSTLSGNLTEEGLLALASNQVIYASQWGCKLNSNVYTGGGTDDSVCLQSALSYLGNNGGGTLVLDGQALVSGATVSEYKPCVLEIGTSTTLYTLPGDGLYLADNSDSSFICDHNNNVSPSSTWQPNMKIIGGIFNMNGSNQSHDEQNPGEPGVNYYNSFFWFGAFNGLEISNVTMINPRTYAFFLWDGTNYTFQNDIVDWTTPQTPFGNTDGIHQDSSLSNGYVNNMEFIDNGDDTIAFNTDENLQDCPSNTCWAPWRVPRFANPDTNISINNINIVNGSTAVRMYSVGIEPGQTDNVQLNNIHGNLLAPYTWPEGLPGYTDDLINNNLTINGFDVTNSTIKIATSTDGLSLYNIATTSPVILPAGIAHIHGDYDNYIGSGNDSGFFGINTPTPTAQLTDNGDALVAGLVTASEYTATSSLATSTFAGDVVTGTGSTAAFTVNYNGSASLATTSQTGVLNIGPDSGSATTTIEMGKIQIDGYSSTGSRVCAEIVATSWVITAGACTP